jgi:Rod binding domain-containing protein
MAAINAVNVPLSLQQVQQDSLLQQTKDPKGATTDAKIQKGSKQFEALLLGSWLQQAEHSFASVPGGDDGDDSQRDQVMSFGVQSLATFMAGSGKFGISEMVAKSMEQKADKAAGQTASDPHMEAKKTG